MTPHCAHLPTRPTPKFELGSQPHRFSSTRLPSPSRSSSPPRLVLAHSPIDPLHGKRTGRDVSSLTPSVCVHDVHLRSSWLSPSLSLSFLLAERAIGRRVSAEVCCLPVVFLRGSISMSLATCLSRSLSPNNWHRVLVAVLVRHAAKRLDFARLPIAVSRNRCQSATRSTFQASLLDVTL